MHKCKYDEVQVDGVDELEKVVCTIMPSAQQLEASVKVRKVSRTHPTALQRREQEGTAASTSTGQGK